MAMNYIVLRPAAASRITDTENVMFDFTVYMEILEAIQIWTLSYKIMFYGRFLFHLDFLKFLIWFAFISKRHG